MDKSMNKIRKNFLLDPVIAEKLRLLAFKKRLSMSHLVEEAIRKTYKLK